MLFVELIDVSIADDSCHFGEVYKRPVLHQCLTLHSILSLSES